MNDQHPHLKQPASIGIEQLCAALASSTPAEIIRPLWQIGAGSAHFLIDYEPHGVQFRWALQEECGRLRRLLTENTRIRLQPFKSFADSVRGLLEKITWSGRSTMLDAQALRDITAVYRRDESHFAALGSAVHCAHNGWGAPLLGCVANPSDEFFALAAGTTEHALIHFDQWRWNATAFDELAQQYASRIDRLIAGGAWEDACIVLIKKELGPRGPEGAPDRIFKHLQHSVNVYRLDQRTLTGKLQASGKQPSRFIVLYDLINSGHGLQAVDEHLHAKFSPQETHYVLLYDYKSGSTFQPRQGTTELVFDAKDKAIAPTVLETLLRNSPSLPMSREPATFDRIRLEDVDPVVRDGPSDLAYIVHSPEVAQQYQGRWVAVRHAQVIESGGTLGEVRQRLRELHPDARPLIHYVRPSGAF